MTQDEIIKMAKQAGCLEKHQVFYFVSHELEAFAKLIAEREREACAKICDDKDEIWKKAGLWNPTNEYKECADAIRARGQA